MTSTGATTLTRVLSICLIQFLEDSPLEPIAPRFFRLRQRQLIRPHPGEGSGSTITLSPPFGWAVHWKL